MLRIAAEMRSPMIIGASMMQRAMQIARQQ